MIEYFEKEIIITRWGVALIPTQDYRAFDFYSLKK